MKILHVIPAIAPRYGGPSQAVIEMCLALQQAGLTVDICTTDADGDGRLAVGLDKPILYRGVQTHFFRRDRSEAFKFSRSLSQWLDGNVARYDIVHIHAVFSHATYAAAQACQRNQIPYVVRPLGTLEPWSMHQKRPRKLLAWHLFFRRLLQKAAAIHYTTEQERELTEQSLSLRKGIVISNGVNEALLAVKPTGKFRLQYDIPANATAVLCLSRLHPKKGIDLLLKAFLELRTQGKLTPVHLVLAGDGEPSYVDRLRGIVRGTVAESSVHWTGWLEGESKFAALAEANLFVLNSFQENFGIGVVEAMACGTPVLLSRQVGLAADVAKHGAGWIVDLQQDELRSGLLEATADAAETRRRGDNARRLVADRFTWSRISVQLQSLYESLLTSRESATVGEPAHSVPEQMPAKAHGRAR
jgi:glycosyltransferase involved in cell wall biosynthesis